ncbi:general secretion pathway protein GspJ [Thermus sp. LT1-2-5]|uniref:prepilin-type N-terminal cleavage/methylation domain-containing protein n=1 Tax=Thermus sp. LT1-2-5 TaxID=3026935 RepID=UPI0030E88D23
MRQGGLTLLELLLSLAILGLLLGAVLAFTQSTARLERHGRALAQLNGELSLTALVLSREASLAGYRLGEGTALELSPGVEGDRLILRFFCDTGMELYCSRTNMNGVRTVGYRLSQGTLYWGACRGSCEPSLVHPVMDEVEVFRVAYRTDAWQRGSLSVEQTPQGASPKVAMLALYLLARSPIRTKASPFTPGSTVDWGQTPDLDRELLLRDHTPPPDGHPRAERLVVVHTPNLWR